MYSKSREKDVQIPLLGRTIICHVLPYLAFSISPPHLRSMFPFIPSLLLYAAQASVTWTRLCRQPPNQLKSDNQPSRCAFPETAEENNGILSLCDYDTSSKRPGMRCINPDKIRRVTIEAGNSSGKQWKPPKLLLRSSVSG